MELKRQIWKIVLLILIMFGSYYPGVGIDPVGQKPFVSKHPLDVPT